MLPKPLSTLCRIIRLKLPDARDVKPYDYRRGCYYGLLCVWSRRRWCMIWALLTLTWCRTQTVWRSVTTPCHSFTRTSPTHSRRWLLWKRPRNNNCVTTTDPKNGKRPQLVVRNWRPNLAVINWYLYVIPSVDNQAQYSTWQLFITIHPIYDNIIIIIIIIINLKK